MDEFETLTPAKKKEGIVFVISGPSGSGKGTVIGHLKEMYLNLGLAVSATTRDMRPGEREGVEYFFKTREEFERMIRDGEVLEHTVYNGNYYGTLRSEAERILGEGLDLHRLVQERRGSEPLSRRHNLGRHDTQGRLLYRGDLQGRAQGHHHGR